MPDHGDENSPLTSSKKFSSIRFRRLSISSKRRSELKAAISGPRIFDGGGGSATVFDGAPLRTLNSAQLLHTNSASTASGLSLLPPQETFARGLRRNSDIPLRKHLSNLAWPTNHPGISPVRESPRQNRAALRKPRKADISRPLIPESPRLSTSSGVSRKRSRRSAQINHGSRFSGTTPSSILKGNPFEESESRTMNESFPALDLGLNAGAVSFGSVKERTGKMNKALRASRTTLLLASQEIAKPELVYTDDSDAFSSPPSTPLTPVWETAVTSSIPEADPKLATRLELADVHAQIQAMIDSANRLSLVKSGDFPVQDQEPSSTHGGDILPYLRPSSPMYESFPRLAITHRRSASSPPLGSGIHHAYPPDFRDRLLYRPITPAKQTPPLSLGSPPSKPPSTSTSPTSVDAVAPTTPTKKSLSEQSDSPSVYSEQSPSSQIDDVTPTSSSTSSPDHPYTTSKHERLLAAISEGISSPTKSGPTAPSILGSRHSRSERSDLARPHLRADIPAVPVIVVTGPNDGNLVYSESNFSIVDMYTSPAESVEAGQRRRTRTTHSYQYRPALEPSVFRTSISFNSPRRSQLLWEGPPSSTEPPKRRVSVFRSGLPSSFLSMSTLHEVEVAEKASTSRDRKSFYAAVGLKGLFRRSSSKALLAQAQANSATDAAGGEGRARPGSASLAAPGTGDGDDASKGGWGLFKWKR